MAVDRPPDATSSAPPAPGLFVAVEGPTGTGKNGLAQQLAIELGADTVYDPLMDNHFLVQAATQEYRDPVLQLQVELTILAARIASLRRIQDRLAAGRDVVTDWTLLKQVIYAELLLPEADVSSMKATVEVWSDQLPEPDVVVGLSGPLSVVRSRVRDRYPDRRQFVTTSSLALLSTRYAAQLSDCGWPLIRLDITTVNPYALDDIRRLGAQVRQERISTGIIAASDPIPDHP